MFRNHDTNISYEMVLGNKSMFKWLPVKLFRIWILINPPFKNIRFDGTLVDKTDKLLTATLLKLGNVNSTFFQYVKGFSVRDGLGSFKYSKFYYLIIRISNTPTPSKKL